MHTNSMNRAAAILAVVLAILVLTGCVTFEVPLPRTALAPMGNSDEALTVVILRDRAAEIAPFEEHFGSHTGEVQPLCDYQNASVVTRDSFQDWVADGLEAGLRSAGFATRQASDPGGADLIVRFAIEWLSIATAPGLPPSCAVNMRVRVLASPLDGPGDEFFVDARFHEQAEWSFWEGVDHGATFNATMTGARAEFVKAACDRIAAFEHEPQ